MGGVDGSLGAERMRHHVGGSVLDQHSEGLVDFGPEESHVCGATRQECDGTSFILVKHPLPQSPSVYFTE